MNKKVSVIICTYKGADFLERAILSVLRQSYQNIEVIVVDDNGKDTPENLKTKKIIDKYLDNVIYFQHEVNMNGAVARNTGIEHATGEYICFLDDDDLMLENRVEVCVNKLEEETNYNAVFVDVLCTDQLLKPSRIITIRKEGNCYKELMLNSMFLGTGSNIFMTMEACKKNGRFDEKFLRHQDLEYMIRFYRKFKSTYIPEIQLIKAKNNTNNIPNYIRLKEIKEQYFFKFEDEIKSFTREEKERFEQLHGKELYYAYILNSSNKKEKFEFKYSARKSSLLFLFLAKSGLYNTSFFTYMNNLRKNKLSKKISLSLDSKVIYFLEEFGNKNEDKKRKSVRKNL